MTPRPAPSLSVGASLHEDDYRAVRCRMVLDHCKWDPQVGDVATLARFPLLMPRRVWNELAADAERLAAELARAEEVLLHAPRLQRWIGVPRALRRILHRGAAAGMPPCPARVMRFDFHPTTEGWRISEVNSDVPGGFSESSSLARLIGEHFPDAVPAGDPAAVWVDAINDNSRGLVVLLAAPGFMEDQQVVAYLARRLREQGRECALANPLQLEWRDGRAYLGSTRIGALVRFYQAEWLTSLPRRCGWAGLLAGGETPVTNPAVALLSESKRFPLAWDELSVALPTWRRLLPETRDPRDAPWKTDDAWLIKSAYCNTGDSVTIRALATPQRWRTASRDAWLRPRNWVAQRRFHTLALDSPIGPIYPCIGVFVIEGRAAGAYARISRNRVIDYAATDVALLIREDKGEGDG